MLQISDLEEAKRSDKVCLVGGGPSLSNAKPFSINDDYDTIAVNGSIDDINDANYFVTIDYMFIQKHSGVLSKADTIKIFVANFGCGNLEVKSGVITDVKHNIKYDKLKSNVDLIIKSVHQDGISNSWEGFRSGRSSGASALQLAYLLGYKEINLLGYDFRRWGNKLHYHSLYSNNSLCNDRKLEQFYKSLKRDIEKIRDKVKIYSCSPISRLNEDVEFKPVQSVMNNA